MLPIKRMELGGDYGSSAEHIFAWNDFHGDSFVREIWCAKARARGDRFEASFYNISLSFIRHFMKSKPKLDFR